jgi:hypothetical protein
MMVRVPLLFSSSPADAFSFMAYRLDYDPASDEEGEKKGRWKS